MQLAMALAQSAAVHSNDKKYASPYSQEAVKQGIDIPWILRLATASFSDGKFKLGHLKVLPLFLSTYLRYVRFYQLNEH